MMTTLLTIVGTFLADLAYVIANMGTIGLIGEVPPPFVKEITNTKIILGAFIWNFLTLISYILKTPPRMLSCLPTCS